MVFLLLKLFNNLQNICRFLVLIYNILFTQLFKFFANVNLNTEKTIIYFDFFKNTIYLLFDSFNIVKPYPLTTMKRNRTLLVIFFFVFCVNLFSQNQEKKWILAFGSASVLYSSENSSAVGVRYLELFPRVAVGRYMFKNVTFVGSISSSNGATQKYITFDGEARYDFGTSGNRISPYISVGGSFIAAKHLTPTINLGAGGTLWISDKFGLTGQILFKLSETKFSSQRSHNFGTAGLVYRFSLSKNNESSSGRSKIRTSKRKRLWNSKN